jgi:hypothetical protein
LSVRRKGLVSRYSSLLSIVALEASSVEVARRLISSDSSLLATRGTGTVILALLLKAGNVDDFNGN